MHCDDDVQERDLIPLPNNQTQGAQGFCASAFATSFLIPSPRMSRATILPSGPTSTNAGDCANT